MFDWLDNQEDGFFVGKLFKQIRESVANGIAETVDRGLFGKYFKDWLDRRPNLVVSVEEGHKHYVRKRKTKKKAAQKSTDRSSSPSSSSSSSSSLDLKHSVTAKEHSVTAKEHSVTAAHTKDKISDEEDDDEEKTEPVVIIDPQIEKLGSLVYSLVGKGPPPPPPPPKKKVPAVPKKGDKPRNPGSGRIPVKRNKIVDLLRSNGHSPNETVKNLIKAARKYLQENKIYACDETIYTAVDVFVSRTTDA